MEKTKTKSYGLGISIFMFISALFQLLNLMREASTENYTIISLISSVSCILIGIAFLIKREKLALIGYAVGLVRFFSSFWAIKLIAIVSVLSTIFLLFCATTELSPKMKDISKKLFILPLIFELIVFMLSFVRYDGYNGLFYIIIIIRLMKVISTLFLCLFIKYPNGKEVKLNTYNNSQNGECDSEMFIPLVKHILLLIFTVGIYYYIWIYKTTDILNIVKSDKSRNTTKELLLCIFIPFYIIFWIYKTAQIVDEFAKDNNVQSDLSTLCLILAIFVSVVPPILIQDKINSIVSGGKNNVVVEEQPAAAPTSNADELKKYKELLDMGAITLEEYEAKKRELL